MSLLYNPYYFPFLPCRKIPKHDSTFIIWYFIIQIWTNKISLRACDVLSLSSFSGAETVRFLKFLSVIFYLSNFYTNTATVYNVCIRYLSWSKLLAVHRAKIIADNCSSSAAGVSSRTVGTAVARSERNIFSSNWTVTNGCGVHVLFRSSAERSTSGLPSRWLKQVFFFYTTTQFSRQFSCSRLISP